jgi:hypothetical protein
VYAWSFARNTHDHLDLAGADAVIDTVTCGHLRDLRVTRRVDVELIAMGLRHRYCRWADYYSDEVELPEMHCTEGNHQQGDVHEDLEMLDTIIRFGQLKCRNQS